MKKINDGLQDPNKKKKEGEVIKKAGRKGDADIIPPSQKNKDDKSVLLKNKDDK